MSAKPVEVQAAELVSQQFLAKAKTLFKAFRIKPFDDDVDFKEEVNGNSGRTCCAVPPKVCEGLSR